MSIPETVLIFVGAPAAIIAVVTLTVLGPGMMRAQARYRPGRPWSHEPAWFVPRAADPSAPAGGEAHGVIHAAHSPALADPSRTAPVGGASGEW